MFNSSTAKAISRDIENALKEIEQKHGITIRSAGGKFSAQTMSLKLELVKKGDNGEVRTAEEIDWPIYARSFGFEVSDLGREFSTFQGTYKICGIKPKSRKFPILAKRSDGKVFKFPANSVKVALAAKAATV